MYKEVIKRSWNSFNINLFIPDLIFFFITLLTVVITIFTSGLFSFLLNNFAFIQTETFPQLFTGFLKTNLFRFVLSLIAFIVVTFFVGVSTAAMKLAMIKDTVTGKKIKFRLGYGKEFFWAIVRLRILIFLIFLIIVLFGLAWINFVNYFKFSAWLVLFGIVIAVLSLLLFFVIMVFRYPIMFLNNRNAVVTLTESLFYTKNNKKHVLIVISLLVLFGILSSLLTSITSTLSNSIVVSLKNQSIVLFVFIATTVINTFVNMVFFIWKDLFLFYNFKLKKTIY